MGGMVGGTGDGMQAIQSLFGMQGNGAMQGLLPLLMMGMNAMQGNGAMQTAVGGMGSMQGGMGGMGVGMGGGTGGCTGEPKGIQQYRLRGYAGPARDAPVAIEYLATNNDTAVVQDAETMRGKHAQNNDAGELPAASNAPVGPDRSPPANDSSVLPLSTATAALVATAKQAVMKKPGCKAPKSKQTQAPKAKAKAQAKAKAKSSAKAKGKAKAAPVLDIKYRKRARPNGCSKCRGKVGCTESCFRSNTAPW